MTLKQLYEKIGKVADYFAAGDLVGAAKCLLEIAQATVDAITQEPVALKQSADDAEIQANITKKFAEVKATASATPRSKGADGTLLQILIDAVERLLPLFFQLFPRK